MAAALPYVVTALKVYGAAKAASSLSKSPTITPPTAPTIDTAAGAAADGQNEYDRLRRRRGVLSTVFGGAESGAPTVATKTLLGS